MEYFNFIFNIKNNNVYIIHCYIEATYFKEKAGETFSVIAKLKQTTRNGLYRSNTDLRLYLHTNKVNLNRHSSKTLNYFYYFIININLVISISISSSVVMLHCVVWNISNIYIQPTGFERRADEI